jgi:hypothetical protein
MINKYRRGFCFVKRVAKNMSKKRLKQHKTRINCYPNDLDHFAGTNPVTNASNHSKEHFRVATRVVPPEYHQKKRNEHMKSSGSLSHKVSGNFGKIWAARMVESRLALQLYRALLKVSHHQLSKPAYIAVFYRKGKIFQNEKEQNIFVT